MSTAKREALAYLTRLVSRGWEVSDALYLAASCYHVPAEALQAAYDDQPAPAG